MKLIEPYYGQTVAITLRSHSPARVKGVLKQCDGVFLIIKQPEGSSDLIVPVTSVLHIEPIG